MTVKPFGPSDDEIHALFRARLNRALLGQSHIYGDTAKSKKVDDRRRRNRAARQARRINRGRR